ncbi:aldo/keto reductase [Corynebacterium choanae]|nr:aldo/keto reductase [Corynebacterium choanae]
MDENNSQYQPHPQRYESMQYRRLGNSGLQVSAIALGMWHNFGHDKPFADQRAIVLGAFDRGITHFDLANNYGPPSGSAETAFGMLLDSDLHAYRDELVIATKAGWRGWDGPYGFGGSRKYLMASLDRSLQRLGVDYVDIFYHHRPDPDTPLEETMGALRDIVASGKALYAGVSSYSPELLRQAAEIMDDEGCPLVCHQPSYSMLNRWVEEPTDTDGTESLLEAAADTGVGIIAFSPLAQGLLTDRYLHGVPEDSRAAAGKSLASSMLSESNLEMVRRLNDIAQERGQTLAQMALSWVLRRQGEFGEQTVASAVIGASSLAQLDQNIGALEQVEFSAQELAAIDDIARDAGINIWAAATRSKLSE